MPSEQPIAWRSAGVLTVAVPPNDKQSKKRLLAAGLKENMWRPPNADKAPAPATWRWFTGGATVYTMVALWDFLPPALREDVQNVRLEYELSFAKDSLDDYPCPPGEAYLPFQRAGIQYALARRNAIIADEMGLGKTVQALGVANTIDARKIFVVCPASVRLQWAAAARRWLVDGPDRIIVPLFSLTRGFPSKASVIVTSYDLMRNPHMQNAAREYKPDLLILDEAHFLKAHSARRTRAVLGDWRENTGLIGCAGKVLALTGTPLPNRPHELYNLVRALDWEAIDKMTEERFIQRYCPTEMIRGNLVVTPLREAELQARLRSRLMIRRLKADVATELPAKTYEIVEVPEDGAIRKALKAEAFLNLDLTRITKLSIEEQSALATVRREMGLAKVPRVVEHVVSLLESGVEKLTIFAWHRDVIAAIDEALAAQGYGTVTLTGATPVHKRAAVVQHFVVDPDCRAFIAQMQAGGVGIDGLQKVCSVAIFAEPSWTPADNEQCADRLHRTGQSMPVTVQFLVAPGSLDAKVLGAALRKARTADAVLDRRK